MRSAAESEELGCPEPAALEERIESTRSWRASSRYVSSAGRVGVVVATARG